MAANTQRSGAAKRRTAPLSAETINEHVLEAEYAVRGEIVGMAQRIAAELEAGQGDHPFSKVVWCNIGNPQLLGQQPITYYRQVLALLEYPAVRGARERVGCAELDSGRAHLILEPRSPQAPAAQKSAAAQAKSSLPGVLCARFSSALAQLLDHPNVAQLFPSDVISRARQLLQAIPGGVGAYSESAGATVLRKMVAEAIERRDGVPASADDIYMTDGASPAVHYMMDLLLRDGGHDGLMVPIPQYPLYRCAPAGRRGWCRSSAGAGAGPARLLLKLRS